MFAGVLRVHEGLLASSRVPSLCRPERAISAIELAVLVLLGFSAAAATMLLDFSLRIPGHAILRSVFPMALGLALVPRQAAGSIMGASAVATAFLFHAGDASGSPGAMTSLALTGPLLDLALLGAKSPWRLYLGFVLAGLGSNLAAFFVRWSVRAMDVVPRVAGGGGGGGGGRGGGGGGGGGRGGGGGGAISIDDWLALAPWTYIACGILAGLLSALIWFHFRRRHELAKVPGAP